MFYLTPAASEGYRSTLKPTAFQGKSPSSNLSAQVIHQEQPLSEKAALNPDWVEWLMGFPKGWTAVSSGERNPQIVPRITDDTKDRALRLKTLGNAVCPPQAYPIFHYIAAIETGACASICPYGGGDG